MALVSSGLLQLPTRGDCPSLLELLTMSQACDLASAAGVVAVSRSAPRPHMDAALTGICTCARTNSQRLLEQMARQGSDAAKQLPPPQHHPNAQDSTEFQEGQNKGVCTNQPACSEAVKAGPHLASAGRQGSAEPGTLPASQCALQSKLLEHCGPCVRLAPTLVQLVQRMLRVFFLQEGTDFSRCVPHGYMT
jgi:hypothetical protein